MSQDERLTFGQKMVGIKFNPSEGETHDKVHRIKSLYAEVIDIIREQEGGPQRQGLAGDFDVIAIQQAVLAQMAAVKAVTWKEPEDATTNPS